MTAHQTPCLLLVDDDALIVATLTSILHHAGYSVASTTSAAHALQLCAEHHFHLAIADVRMPHMNGIELARKLQRDHTIPVAFLSAERDLDALAAAEDIEPKGFFRKPIDPLKILPTLRAIVAQLPLNGQSKNSRGE